MSIVRDSWECGDPNCIGDDDWPVLTKKKGRDRVCPRCNWIQIGYRSLPEEGYKRVKINREELYALYPNQRPGLMAGIFTTLHGYLHTSKSRLELARVPNLLGKIVYTVIGFPIAVLMNGLPETVSDYWPEIIRPIKYGKFSSKTVFAREMDEEDFRSLYK